MRGIGGKVLERTLNTRKRWRESVLLWSACAVVGAALMALAVVARLSHEPLYGSALPAYATNYYGTRLKLELPDGRYCDVFYIGELVPRRILGSIVPYFRWDFVKDDQWMLTERTTDGYQYHAVYTDFSEVLELLDDPGARVTGISEFGPVVGISFPPPRDRGILRGPIYSGKPGVTDELARLALDRARQTYERDPQAWQRVRSFQQGGSDAIVVYTELDYPSVWVFLGQFVTVHPWVFGVGLVMFGGGMFGFVKYGVVRGRRRKRGRCLRCGYEMREVVEAMRERGEERIVCPECGSEVEG